MKKPWMIITSIVILILLVLFSIIGGFFSGWTFFGIIFYFALYVGGYLFVTIGMKNREREHDTMIQRKNKFDYCWERINQILKAMPGGQGVEWASGVGRKSGIKSYFDGVQNKPFRSILAHLENTQQIVMIIFDIEGDDISEFVTNPTPELMENPFLNFRPFTRGVENKSGLDRFGGFNSGMRAGYQQPRRGGVSINVEPEGFGDFDLANQKRTTPEKSVIDSGIAKLNK